MALPNPGMDFDPLDVLTAAELDQMVANIEALAAGTAAVTNISHATTAIANPYKFSAYNTGGSNLAAATFTKVTYNTEEYDTNNNFDSTTNYRYTAPITGFYKFSAAFEVTAGGSDTYAISIYKNGTEVKRGNKLAMPSGIATTTLVVVPPPLSLTAGDYIEVWGYNSSGGGKSITAGQSLTYFGGELVSRT